MRIFSSLRWLFGIALATTLTLADTPMMKTDQVETFVRMALAGMDREYPYKPGDVLGGPQDIVAPRAKHPVFYGHFDWHSSVHGHWMLVRLLRLHPQASWATEVRGILTKRFTEKALAAEAAHFAIKENKSFERMYGWAWVMRLGIELRTWDDADARRWSAYLQPLENQLASLMKDYLPKLEWPVRCGFHPETAFPLSQFYDWSVVTHEKALQQLIAAKARVFYAGDVNYPVAYEPSGNDFFSPGLNAADLMRRVLSEQEFASWLQGYFPALAQGKLGNLLTPAHVSDPSDGHLIHLAGLNLTRAWTMKGIASSLPAADARRKILSDSAAAHTREGLKHVSSGHYEGEHWLASFAVYLLTDVGVTAR
ncbi:MAG: hypothetical protein RI957_502 [Verrucomicrobiota bacterium]|jgi:hypothetical protein